VRLLAKLSAQPVKELGLVYQELDLGNLTALCRGKTLRIQVRRGQSDSCQFQAMIDKSSIYRSNYGEL